MVLAANHAQAIQTVCAIIMASAKELALEKETVVASVIQVTLGTPVQSVLWDITNHTRMKRPCCAPHVMQHARGPAKVLDRRIVRSARADGK